MGIWGPYEIPWPILGGAVEVRNHSEQKKNTSWDVTVETMVVYPHR